VKARHFRSIAWAVSRPVTMGMLFLALLGVGAIATWRLPIALVPNGWGEQSVSIGVPFPDANPREVEERAIRPVEEEMRTIPGVRSVSSNSREGIGWINVRFHGRVDMDMAYADVRDRIERVRPSLPERIPRIWTWRFSLEDMPVVWCAFLFEEQEERSNWLVEEVIQKRLEAVDGVARVEIWGLMDETVRIYLDEDRIRASRLDLREVVTRLSRDNFAVPAGKVEEGGKRFLLRSDAKFRNLEEIRSIPVAPGVTVADLGEVREVRAVRQRLFRVNGKYAYHAAIYRESNANAVEVSGRLGRAFEDLEKDPALAGFAVQKFFDQGKMIQRSLSDLGATSLEGAVLAVVVLLLFFRRLRATLLVAAAIPASVIVVLPLLYFRGDSFNLLTMMGITLAVGMLVDNAIVVIENTIRLREEGRSIAEASVEGPSEVGMAVTASTLTTVIVFAPLIFLSQERNLRLAMEAIGLPLCASILASLVLALYFQPTASKALLRDRAPRTPRRFLRLPLAGKVFPAVNRGQVAVLDWCLRHRILASLGTLLLLFSYAIPAGHLQKVGDQGDEAGEYEFRVELPRNFTLAEASEEVGVYERFLSERKESLGYKDLGAGFDRSNGWLSLYYERGLSLEDRRALAKRLRDELPKRPGVRLRLDVPGEDGEARRNADGLRLALTGPDSETLATLADEVKTRLGADPVFESVETAIERGTEEMRVELDRDRLRDLNVSPAAVRGTIEWALRGFPLARFEEEGRERLLVVGFDPEGRDDLGHLRDLSVFSESGASYPLAAFAKFVGGKSYREIRRRDGKTRLVVTARVSERDTFRAWSHVSSALAGMEFPRGYGWEEDGGARDLEDTFKELGATLNLSIVLVYFLMGILFESAILPLSILLTIPFAGLGAVWALYLTGTPLDPVGFIGVILLVGVVVNNGIVLIDRVNQLRREQGMDRRAAVLKGSHDRLRPVLMTALTTILGLLPMAMAESNPQEGISYRALAIAVAGGLAVSTLFTLWVVPLFYTLVDDLGRAFRSAFGRAWARRRRPAAALE
jgi:hydrophobic/amphiphilic exporter-1 (mainly G- bacteria), HAE1 family